MVDGGPVESRRPGLGDVEGPVLLGCDPIETRLISHSTEHDGSPRSDQAPLFGSSALQIVGLDSTGCSADEAEELDWLDWRVRLDCAASRPPHAPEAGRNDARRTSRQQRRWRRGRRS